VVLKSRSQQIVNGRGIPHGSRRLSHSVSFQLLERSALLTVH
jgi:hypothetical protein